MSLLEKHRDAHPAIKLLALAWDLRWRYACALIPWVALWVVYAA